MLLSSRRGTLLSQNLPVPIGAELAYAQTDADFALASGAPVPIPSLTVTVDKDSPRPFDIEYDVTTNNTTTGQGATILLYRNAVYVEGLHIVGYNNNVNEQKHRIRREENLPEGQYIYQLYLGRFAAGTATLMGTFQPCFLRAVQR